MDGLFHCISAMMEIEEEAMERYVIEIFDPIQSEYLVVLRAAHKPRQAQLLQRLGKIWRVRITPRRHDNDSSTLLALPGRAYTEYKGYRIGNAVLRIAERQNQHDATAFSVWDGGILLADYLQARPVVIQGKHVLELGAGLGLVGLTAAALGAQSVVLTDLVVVMPCLSQNIATNQALWQAAGCTSVTCTPLDWFDPYPLPRPPNSSTGDCWNVILLADCVWTLDLVSPLIRTLTALIHRAKTVGGRLEVLISYQRRGLPAHEAFWDNILSLFDVQELDPLTVGINNMSNPKLLLRRCIPK